MTIDKDPRVDETTSTVVDRTFIEPQPPSASSPASNTNAWYKFRAEIMRLRVQVKTLFADLNRRRLPDWWQPPFL
jgi:hypothetical protein